MKTVGFTGARRGMTGEQARKVMHLLDYLRSRSVVAGLSGPSSDADRFEHGGAVGADVQAAMIAGNLGYWVARFPGNNPEQQDDSFVDHERAEPQDNLVRNRVIVARADVVIAAPASVEKLTPRSGTWFTVRECRLTRTPHYVVPPDGSCVYWSMKEAP